jgi:hypothetical protein
MKYIRNQGQCLVNVIRCDRVKYLSGAKRALHFRRATSVQERASVARQ